MSGVRIPAPTLVAVRATSSGTVTYNPSGPGYGGHVISNWTSSGGENFDTGSNISSSVFTAPVAGYYRITFRGSLTLNSTTNRILLRVSIVKNGGNISSNNFNIENRNAYSPGLAGEIHELIHLNTSDTITGSIRMEADSAGGSITSTVNTGSMIHIFLETED